ncbi:penicillin-binding protein 1B [Alteromonas lipolytica]|uniref:Penicillin-binding protein 1B n=1 Tax=Alteromonas lipolytica TaxID=1856405 RepID=A0A1E8FBP2_9ALTE|nr:penicillin-binding protein 1B [Alteromonas lipolytica]OFI33206.1 penicillin-binding protein 1B [Alteromonas lipolytica]GGF61623.1 penicillin-binding protein 1B [Alteromonas lipolytica]
MTSKKTESTTKPIRKRWLWRLLWKLIFIALVLLGAYVIYLDAQIKHHFSGNKWQVPAQIYARPLQLQTGEEITRKEVLDELTLLGYRRVSRIQGSGEYSVGTAAIHIYRRAFHFPDGFQPLRQLEIRWNGSRIAAIKDMQTAQQLEQVRLESWLVTRLASGSQEDRMLVNLKEVPQLLVKALTLTEDRDFYSHHGVAPLSIIRALLANIAAGRTVQGGSTLTQQLVKNLYLSRERSLERKIKEALMAVIIDARYSKDEIIQAYLNEVFLGQSGDMAVHGFGLASYFYFDRPVYELDETEIAMLVGMIKGPSYYNPRKYPERAVERRNLVLRLLLEGNEISPEQYELAVSRPVGIASGDSLATGKHPAFMAQVRRELQSILADPNIRESGVKVFTTLDINAQRRAEQALTGTLDALQQGREAELEGGMVVTDIGSGEVRALIGGRQVSFAGFNRALDAVRPIGSLVKPAVYLTALEQPAQYNLATPLEDKPLSLSDERGDDWQPKNFDKKYRGTVPLVDALSLSLNVPTVNLGLELGIDNVAATLRNLGVKRTIPEVPALTLGAVALTPFETNQMYQTIANNGAYRPLHTVTAIVSVNDRLMWRKAEYGEQRINEEYAYLLNYALYKVTTEGTAKAVGKTFPNINMAGKTGTTDDYRDSWFAGFDRNNLVTVWVGNDDNKSTGLTGSSGALPVFIAYQKLQEPKSLSRRFPNGLGIAHFDAQTGVVVTAGCQGSMSVPAVLEALPPAQGCAGQPGEKAPAEKAREKSWWERLFGG